MLKHPHLFTCVHHMHDTGTQHIISQCTLTMHTCSYACTHYTLLCMYVYATNTCLLHKHALMHLCVTFGHACVYSTCMLKYVNSFTYAQVCHTHAFMHEDHIHMLPFLHTYGNIHIHMAYYTIQYIHAHTCI